MWARLMTVAFLTNGLGAFGLRVMSGIGLSEQFKLPYLVLWYTAGFLFAAAVSLRRTSVPTVRELAYSAAAALASTLGQLGMAFALDRGVPGYVVFQVAPGGGLLVVVLVGILAIKEPISGYGIAGIVLGTAALVVLGFS